MYLPTKDLTICVDVQPNPGPVSPQATKPPFSSFGGSFRHAVNTNLHVSHQDKAVVSHTRLQLLNVRRTRHCSPTSSALLTTLKVHSILRFSGRRAGKHKIPTRITVNSPKHLHIDRYKNRVVNRANITIVPVSRSLLPALDSTTVTVSRPFNVAEPSSDNQSANQSSFAVPKCLFTNINSLVKVKNHAKATTTLEADMQSTDIDVCVVSETYLKPEIPDALVRIPGYTIYSTDRNQFGNDSRKKVEWQYTSVITSVL